MRHIAFAVVMAYLFTVGRTNEGHAQMPASVAPATQITEIAIERTPCEGACPVDKVLLRADGSAIYWGERAVDHIGRYVGKVSRRDFERLTQVVNYAGFFQLQNRYTAPATDMSGVITTIRRGAVTKSINNYGDAGPFALWTVQSAIQGVAANAKWQWNRKLEKTDLAAGIRGVAEQSPVRGGPERADQPNQAPLPKAIITAQPDAGGVEIARVVADENGKFVLLLEPGKYLIVPLAPNPGAKLPRGATQHIVVAGGKFTDVIVEYDTGMR